MKRKSLFIVLTSLVVIGAGALSASFYTGWKGKEEAGQVELSPPPTPLNLVLVTLDTTRADHLGAYGYKDVSTPHIDALAKNGVLFNRAISVAPITLPSHSSIMTGLYPPSHGVRDNGTFTLPDTVTTLAEMLKHDGYATGAFVGAAVLERRYGLTQGFDVYDDDFSQGWRRQQFMYAERPCEQVVAASLRWLEQRHNERFFIWLHFYDPHAGYDPPEPWATQYNERPYDGEIAYSDHCLGKLFGALRAWGVWNDTMIVLTADHGESLGEHGEKTHGLFIYDATVHVPLVFHAPLILPAGRAVDAVVSSVDIYPTILALLGKESADPLDGKSLSSLMRGRREPLGRTAYSEALLPKYHYGWAELKGVTTQTWKLIDAPQPELYALHRDPKELVNIYERDPGTVRGLRKSLVEIEGRKSVPESRIELDAEAAERLRGLGYIWMPGPGEEQAGETPSDPKNMIKTHRQVQQGREFYRRERFDEAITEFQQVLATNPKSVSTYFDLALTYLAKGELRQAKEPLSSVLNLDPQNPRVYSMMGIVENRLGNRQEALQLFQRATELNPNFVEAYVHIAAWWEQEGALDKAEVAVRAGLKTVPNHAGARSRLGSILLARGEPTAAEEQLRAALRSDPHQVQAHRSLGTLYDQQGRYDEALKEYQEALKSDARLADVHLAIGVLYTKQGKFEQAEVQLKEAQRIDPHLTQASVSLAIVYDQQRLWEKALETNRHALALNPQAYEAYGNMAVVYIKQGDLVQAEEVLRKALDIEPNYPEGYNNLAALLLEKGEITQAIAAAEQALQQRSEYPEALANLGILYDKQGEFERAIEYHQQALALNPDYWQARNNLAVSLLHLHRYTEAAAALAQVVLEQPNLAAAHKHLGDVYFEHLKQWDKARAHYRIYLDLRPLPQEQEEIAERLRQLG